MFLGQLIGRWNVSTESAGRASINFVREKSRLLEEVERIDQFCQRWREAKVWHRHADSVKQKREKSCRTTSKRKSRLVTNLFPFETLIDEMFDEFFLRISRRKSPRRTKIFMICVVSLTCSTFFLVVLVSSKLIESQTEVVNKNFILTPVETPRFHSNDALSNFLGLDFFRWKSIFDLKAFSQNKIHRTFLFSKRNEEKSWLIEFVFVHRSVRSKPFSSTCSQQIASIHGDRVKSFVSSTDLTVSVDPIFGPDNCCTCFGSVLFIDFIRLRSAWEKSFLERE